MSEPVIHPLTVRYMEVDAQHVVFNGWYFTYFDEAMGTFLRERGLSYPDMIESGYDVQVVHSEMDWKSGVRWTDEVAVAVSTARIGRTSFALDFELRRDGSEVTCSARNVYVVIAADGSGKREIPPSIAAVLGAPAPLRPA
ncbi:thioesterase family protein [Actinomycetes bacterium KLBMP 9759]